jgi:ADP-ribosylglycohydrolase
MIGAIIGDIVGSRFEFDNLKSKDFELFTAQSCFTDDSVMTMAIAKTLCDCRNNLSNLKDVSSHAIMNMQSFGRQYINAGYGNRFLQWLLSDDPKPYNSFGNGSAMRVSPVGFIAKDLNECKALSRAVTEVTHNHREGIKGAEAIAVCVFLAKSGLSKELIKNHVNNLYYNMDFTLDSIREKYPFHVSCQQSVPQAIEAFLESNDFEDCIRNAISIGGDSDTIAAMAGSIAEAFYGVNDELKAKAKSYCDSKMFYYIEELENSIPKTHI